MRLQGSPFHVDAGFHPVRSLVEARCGIRGDAGGAERLECLTREVADLGLDPAQTVPLLAPVLGIDPSAGYDQAATEGRKLEEQVAQAVLAYIVACTRGRPGIVVAEDLHWFDDATRCGRGRARAGRTGKRARRRDLAQPGATPVGDHRAAPADPRRQPRAHRRARGGHGRAGSARARHGLWWHPALPRGAGASGRGPAPRPAPAAPLPCPGRCPRCSTSRSWPGSTPRRRRCRWPRRSPPPGPRSIARCSPRPCPSRPGSWTRASGLWSTRASWSGSRAVAARYHFRHELLREVAYELQPPSWRRKVHEPALRRPHPRRAERLACPRVALRARGAPSGGGGRLPAHGRVGAAAWGAGRGSVAPHAGDRPRHAAGRRRDARSSRGRAAPAPGVPRHVGRGRGQRRCVRRLRPLPRAGRGRSHGRRHVQHADLGVGLRPVTGRARPRPPPVRGAARRPRRRA